MREARKKGKKREKKRRGRRGSLLLYSFFSSFFFFFFLFILSGTRVVERSRSGRGETLNRKYRRCEIHVPSVSDTTSTSHKWRGLRRPRHLWDVDVVSDTEGHMYLTATILASYLGFPLPKRRGEINKKKKKEEKEEEKKKGIEEKKRK